jgi:hypothetical protein
MWPTAGLESVILDLTLLCNTCNCRRSEDDLYLTRKHDITLGSVMTLVMMCQHGVTSISLDHKQTFPSQLES